jgi:hypothetical protein
LELGNYNIELIEKYPCTDKDELRAREQYHIRENGVEDWTNTKGSPLASPCKSALPITPVQDPLEEAIQFLKKKEVYQENPVIRDVHFSLLREPSTAGLASVYYEAVREHLLRLTSSDAETHSDTVPDALHRFDETEFPRYKKDNVFFLKHGNALCQRYQRSGLCYMHGPTMVQHYALQFNGTAQPMLDLVKYICDHFTTKQLKQHLFHDAGGNSICFLRSVLEEGTELLSSGELDTIPDKYALYGPALVSRFEVRSDFYNHQDCHFHYAKPTGEVKGTHSYLQN